MKFYFYQTEPSNSANLHSAFLAIRDLSGADRCKEISDKTLRIQNLRYLTPGPQATTSNYWVGDIVRIRLGEADTPPVVSRDGAMRDIVLSDQEGLGEETTFLYDRQINVLMVQSGISTISPTALLDYVSKFRSRMPECIPNLVLELHAEQRLQDAVSIRSFEIGIANTVNPRLLTDSSQSVSDSIRVLGDSQKEIPVVTVKVSMGRKRGSLDVPTALDTIMQAWRLATGRATSERITKLRVSGTDANGFELPENLLAERMREERGFSGRRRVSYTDRQAAIISAYRARRDELYERFSP